MQQDVFKELSRKNRSRLLLNLSFVYQEYENFSFLIFEDKQLSKDLNFNFINYFTKSKVDLI